jgi:hypothetical protein
MRRLSFCATPSVGLARAVGYDGGMDENPYRSPQSPTNNWPAIPAWRRAVSLLLFVMGAIFCLALPAAAVGALFFPSEFDLPMATFSAIVSATGVATIWLGLRILRRNSESAPTTAALVRSLVAVILVAAILWAGVRCDDYNWLNAQAETWRGRWMGACGMVVVLGILRPWKGWRPRNPD